MSCCCFGAASVNRKKDDGHGSGDLEGENLVAKFDIARKAISFEKYSLLIHQV